MERGIDKLGRKKGRRGEGEKEGRCKKVIDRGIDKLRRE